MRIGIDLGGTKIEGIALGGAGEILFRERTPTPAGDYAATIETVAALVARIEEETGHAGSVGIGIPGAVSPATGLVKNANSTCLIGQPLTEDLRRALQRDVRIGNDADCFTLSEATDGAGSGFGSVFGVILGTGVGGGLVIDGALVSGPNAITGEWGHNPLPLADDAATTSDTGSARVCYCGRAGCIETYLSGPGLSAAYAAETGQNLSAAQIAVRAESGDPDCERLLTQYERNLARGLSLVINIVDPAAIILGGGLSNIVRLYENVPTLLPEYVFSDTVCTSILAPEHGDSSGVRGAAWLWPEQP